MLFTCIPDFSGLRILLQLHTEISYWFGYCLVHCDEVDCGIHTYLVPRVGLHVYQFVNFWQYSRIECQERNTAVTSLASAWLGSAVYCVRAAA